MKMNLKENREICIDLVYLAQVRKEWWATVPKGMKIHFPLKGSKIFSSSGTVTVP